MTSDVATRLERRTVRGAPAWIVFSADEHRFGFPIMTIREVLRRRPATRLPGCSTAVIGLINLRGRLVTVFDLGAALGLEPVLDRDDVRFVIVDHGDRAFGFAVRSVLGLARSVTIDATAEMPVPALRIPDPETHGLAGVGAWKEKPFIALDPDSILDRVLT